jgi:hypothetical protein
MDQSPACLGKAARLEGNVIVEVHAHACAAESVPYNCRQCPQGFQSNQSHVLAG